MAITKKVVAIDLGSNTVNFCAAEKQDSQVRLLARHQTDVGLAEGLALSGEMKNESVERAIQSIHDFVNSLGETRKNFELKAFGCAAFRNAKNAGKVIKQIWQETGIQTEILSGEQEAQWIAHGVLYFKPPQKENILIIDIGGGSVEFMEVQAGTLFQVHSLPLGLTRLFEELGHVAVLSTESKGELNKLFQSHLAKIFNGKKYDALIGSAGIFETLTYEITDQDPMLKITSLPMEALEQKLKDWLESSAQDREQMQHIFLRRRKTLHLGAALLLYVIKSLNNPEVFASPYALAEGAALKMMEDIQA